MRSLLPLLLLLIGCAHLGQVEDGIRQHDLAGAWRSERGDFFQIGCAGAFDLTPPSAAAVQPQIWQGTGPRVSEVTESGFTVSRFPLSSLHYEVEKWPHAESGAQVVMRAEKLRWTRVKALDCP